ncbi:hypothetical protein HAX54_028438, partial [Datura stramonium]|nr:hypothetical protein [Datura stramonium]
PRECDLNFVWDFYDNWDVIRDLNEVKVRGTVISFDVDDLCILMRTRVVPHASLSKIVSHPTYRVIRHVLCDRYSNTKWARQNDGNTRQTFSIEHEDRLRKEKMVIMRVECLSQM